MAMSTVSTSNAFDRLALRTEANAMAITQREPSPLTVMLTKMRYEFALVRIEAKKGKMADQNIIRQALDAAHIVAKDCAPYLHRRLSSLHESTATHDLSRLSDDELETMARLVEKINPPFVITSTMDSTSH
jgi:hypothetical protein